MSGVAGITLAVAAVVAAGDWYAVHTERRPLEYACKPLTMVALLVAALALEPAAGLGPTRAWFVAALVLCLAGDVFLMLPQDLFVPGLGAFLVGHLAYVAGMAAAGLSSGGLLVGAAIVLVALATLGRAILGAVRRGDEPSLAPPVGAYMVVISVMVTSAFGWGLAPAVAGAVLFYASDALIAWNRFVRALPHGRLAIIVTYHLAQFLLVLALV